MKNICFTINWSSALLCGYDWLWYRCHLRGINEYNSLRHYPWCATAFLRYRAGRRSLMARQSATTMELGWNFSPTKTNTYYVIAIVIVLSEGGWKVANPILSSLLAALYFHIDSVLQPSDDFAKYASVAMWLSFRLRSDMFVKLDIVLGYTLINELMSFFTCSISTWWRYCVVMNVMKALISQCMTMVVYIIPYGRMNGLNMYQLTLCSRQKLLQHKWQVHHVNDVFRANYETRTTGK